MLLQDNDGKIDDVTISAVQLSDVRWYSPMDNERRTSDQDTT